MYLQVFSIIAPVFSLAAVGYGWARLMAMPWLVIDTADIASEAVKVLLSPQDFVGSTLDLHGPQQLSN